MFINRHHRDRIVFAVMKAFQSVVPDQIRILVTVDQRFEQEIIRNPPPQ